MKRVLAVLMVTGTLLTTRVAPTDLEIGLTAGATQFISYEDLLRLPQVNFAASNDSNFPTHVHLSGVPIEELKRSLGSHQDMIVAICEDGYRSNYPAAYIAAHHPVLVLQVDGKAQKDWPKTHEGGALGPYVISNPDFTPSFKVLSHSDEAQIPFRVVRLDFRSESQVFGAIAPRREFAPGSPVMDGYKIAEQNCYRCHNMGAEGGRMASIPWPVLGAFAKRTPALFAEYVRHPERLNPKSRMAGSPEYDDQTIAALEAYFSTFAVGEQE